MKARNDVENAQSLNKYSSYPLEWQEREKSNMASALEFWWILQAVFRSEAPLMSH